MSLRKCSIAAAGALLLGTAALAAPPAVSVGSMVYDAQGVEVGKVESVSSGSAVVNTGKNKVGLSVSSFGTGPKGLVIAMNREQLDAAATGAQATAQAEVRAMLTPGSAVYDTAGISVGTVESIDAQYVTLLITDQKVKVPVTAFAKGDKGPMVGMSADQLRAAASVTPPIGTP